MDGKLNYCIVLLLVHCKELAQNLGSAFGRLINETMIPMVARILQVMDERGLINMPLKVNGLEIRVSPVAPLAMAQNMEEINNIMQFMQITATMGNEGQLAVKTGELIDYIGDKLGIPSSVRNTGAERGFLMQQHFFQYNRGTHVEWEAMPGALQRVMQKIKPATYLLEPGQYKDTLPPLHTVEVPLQMEMREYDAMRKNFVLEFPDETAIAQNAAVVTQKLQQLASGFVYTGTQERWLSTHKLDALTDLLAENQRAPTIVWYQYVAEREALQRAFPKAVDVKAAGAIDDWNAGKIEVLLAHPASAGHGLNLQHGGCRMVWPFQVSQVRRRRGRTCHP